MKDRNKMSPELAEEFRKFDEWLDKVCPDPPKVKPPPKRKAEIFEFPPKLSEQELIRRQAIIDQNWERLLREQRELEEEARRSCHRGPYDSDRGL